MLCTVHAYETNRTMIRILCIVRLTPLAQFCSVQPFVSPNQSNSERERELEQTLRRGGQGWLPNQAFVIDRPAAGTAKVAFLSGTVQDSHFQPVSTASF